MSSLASVIPTADRVRWSLEEAAEGLEMLDFALPFLPESMVGAAGLLDGDDALALNHVRAHGYLRTLAFLERALLPHLLSQAAPALFDDAEAFWALTRIVEGEAKHVALLERFALAFETGFGVPCEAIGADLDLAGHVLAEEALAVGLLAVHADFMVQEHYVRSQRDGTEREPCFVRLMKLHWQEEAVHGRVTLELLERLCRRVEPHAVQRGFQGYAQLLHWLDGRLERQVGRDLEAFGRARRPLGEADAARFREAQHASQRDVFLLSGLRHPRLRGAVTEHFPRHVEALGELEAAFASPS